MDAPIRQVDMTAIDRLRAGRRRMIVLSTLTGVATSVLGAALLIHVRAPSIGGAPDMAVATHPYVALGLVVWLAGALFVVAFGVHASTLGKLAGLASEVRDARTVQTAAHTRMRRAA